MVDLAGPRTVAGVLARARRGAVAAGASGGFEPARRRTAIAGYGIAIVARLSRLDTAIATDRAGGVGQHVRERRAQPDLVDSSSATSLHLDLDVVEGELLHRVRFGIRVPDRWFAGQRRVDPQPSVFVPAGEVDPHHEKMRIVGSRTRLVEQAVDITEAQTVGSGVFRPLTDEKSVAQGEIVSLVSAGPVDDDADPDSFGTLAYLVVQRPDALLRRVRGRPESVAVDNQFVPRRVPMRQPRGLHLKLAVAGPLVFPFPRSAIFALERTRGIIEPLVGGIDRKGGCREAQPGQYERQAKCTAEQGQARAATAVGSLTVDPLCATLGKEESV